jgi:hypothetical protein
MHKRNSTTESGPGFRSANISTTERTKNPYKPENLEAIKNFVSTSKSPRIQTLMKANLGRQL